MFNTKGHFYFMALNNNVNAATNTKFTAYMPNWIYTTICIYTFKYNKLLINLNFYFCFG